MSIGKVKGLFKLALAVSSIGLLAACNPVPGAPASEWQWMNDQTLRSELFQKCMQILPAGPVKTHYNDWSEVVDSCEDSAYRQSRRLAKADRHGQWFYQDGTPVK